MTINLNYENSFNDAARISTTIIDAVNNYPFSAGQRRLKTATVKVS